MRLKEDLGGVRRAAEASRQGRGGLAASVPARAGKEKGVGKEESLWFLCFFLFIWFLIMLFVVVFLINILFTSVLFGIGFVCSLFLFFFFFFFSRVFFDVSIYFLKEFICQLFFLSMFCLFLIKDVLFFRCFA